jgi:cation/acetate symporter
MITDPVGGWVGGLLAQPAAWTVPLAFAAMIAVSLATPTRVPPDAGRVLLRLHAPEILAAELRELAGPTARRS